MSAYPLDLFVQSRWTELGITQADFARSLGVIDARVEQYRTRKRPFPVDEISLWVEKLQLVGPKAQEFERLALMSSDKANLVQAIAVMEARTEALENLLKTQGEQMDRINAKIDELIKRATIADASGAEGG